MIKGGGVAISGQEQRQLGGGFLEGPDAPEGNRKFFFFFFHFHPSFTFS